MGLKPINRITVSVDVHTRAPQQGDGSISPPVEVEASIAHLGVRPTRPDLTPDAVDLDAIHPAPALTVNNIDITTTSLAPPQASAGFSLERYRINATTSLPEADAEGFRVHKGRRYVDLHDGSVVYVAMDTDTGLYRARLVSELIASGPLLMRDPESRLWYPHQDADSISVPLTDARLQAFRVDLDFSTVEAGSEGLIRHAGKLYVVIDQRAYQALQDLDASTPQQAVWRIVNASDPVAADSANIYHASRIGESLAITRDVTNTWVATTVGLKGGMRRNPRAQFTRDVLLQRYEPIQAAYERVSASAKKYDELWAEARRLPEAGDGKTRALIALEVHLLKHIRMQTEFVKSCIDNKEWLVHLKAGGLYKQELHVFQLERVQFLNRLMGVMDLRVRPSIAAATVDNFKKSLTHLDKKLKLLGDRQVVVEQILKASPGSADEILEHNSKVPGRDQINYNKLAIYLHLLSDNPDNPPDIGIQSLLAVKLLTAEIGSIPEGEHPVALIYALDRLKGDKLHVESRLTSSSPDKAGYIREIIALIDPFEQRIENRLSDIFDSQSRNTELPNLDQDIDFDFVPPQPVNAPPAPPRKMFRTRQHGTYRVLVGETQTAPDGNVTINVPDLFRPDLPPQRYEKKQGEWQPVRPPIAHTPRPELIREANRLLDKVEIHLAEARAQETRNEYPGEIIRFLGKESERYSNQAAALENHPGATEDPVITGLITRLHTAVDSLVSEGQKVQVRMYKNRNVLDILRLNYLLDHAELTVTKTVDRKPLGKGRTKSFLDVYSIKDRSSQTPLWEAHFHYDNQTSPVLSFQDKGGHLKTLEQSRLGIESQRRDAEAGRPHIGIWRETFDGKTARKIFELAR